MLQFLFPNASRTNSAHDVAVEIAHVVDQEKPIFESATKDAAVLLVMAYHESTFRQNAVGDGGFAHCAYQLHGGIPRDLHDCTMQAYARIRDSARRCPENPLAIYTSGSCTNRGGVRASYYRMAEAQRIEDAALTGSNEEEASR